MARQRKSHAPIAALPDYPCFTLLMSLYTARTNRLGPVAIKHPRVVQLKPRTPMLNRARDDFK